MPFLTTFYSLKEFFLLVLGVIKYIDKMKQLSSASFVVFIAHDNLQTPIPRNCFYECKEIKTTLKALNTKYRLNAMKCSRVQCFHLKVFNI